MRQSLRNSPGFSSRLKVFITPRNTCISAREAAEIASPNAKPKYFFQVFASSRVFPSKIASARLIPRLSSAKLVLKMGRISSSVRWSKCNARSLASLVSEKTSANKCACKIPVLQPRPYSGFGAHLSVSHCEIVQYQWFTFFHIVAPHCVNIGKTK